MLDIKLFKLSEDFFCCLKCNLKSSECWTKKWFRFGSSKPWTSSIIYSSLCLYGEFWGHIVFLFWSLINHFVPDVSYRVSKPVYFCLFLQSLFLSNNSVASNLYQYQQFCNYKSHVDFPGSGNLEWSLKWNSKYIFYYEVLLKNCFCLNKFIEDANIYKFCCNIR